MFRPAERVFMSYYLSGIGRENGAWATTHFESNNFSIQINGLTIEQEMRIENHFSTDTRNIIGRWLDNSPFTSNGLTLFKKSNSFFLERFYMDGTQHTNEVTPSPIDNGIRYDDIEKNPHGEYFTVDHQGALHNFSQNGEFLMLKQYALENKFS